ncbi:anti-sigma factor [Deinococcus sp. HMF7620]|uniref:Anti-sigma factor n=1 Tax=Deinococcus arboris TaxID=2682977 RepID=A0A7C9HQA5_9DEIO|nr:anti-sigma factor [Deinococcus arboris]
MTVNREELVSLALGLLSPDEEAQLRAALDADPALLAAYREDLETLHGLPSALPQTELPPGALDRLLGRLRAEVMPALPAPAPTPSGRVLSPVSLGVLALAAAAAVGFLLLRPAAPGDLLSRFAHTPGALTTTLQSEGTQVGQVVRLPDGRAYLHLSETPPEGRVYQLWRLEGQTPVSVGVLSGRGIEWEGAQTGQTLAVSVEPPGGSEQPTTTPILVQKL